MPGRDGLATLQALMTGPETRHIPVVILTSYGGGEQTIAAMKTGAYDYITKPFAPDEVLRTAARAVEKHRLSRELDQLRARGQPPDDDASGLIGRHPSMRELFKLIGEAKALALAQLGLVPLIVRGIFDIIRDLHAAGVTILLVEQNASLALQIADRAYVLEAGRLTIAGPAAELLTDDRVRRAYLG